MSSQRMASSAQLKFGVDRILSTQQPQPPRPVVLIDRTSCPECLRGYLHQVTYPQLLHNPKPIRPFSSHAVEDRSKRKRSWSRAVFSSLQRKGLEKRFQLQKYITKPDRRQLAATLGLTDAQVKVWFQNRRMKWRHTKEMKYQSTVESNQKVGGTDENASIKKEQTNQISIIHSKYLEHP